VKKIEAIVRPHMLEPVKDALSDLGIQGMTVSECRGFGRSVGKPELFRGAPYVTELVPKIKIEIVVPDPLIHQVLQSIADAVRSGRVGDGKIFVETVREAVRIRTGETGDDAL
jgi:nitrogen regulatory protein P-II 1